MTETDVNPVNCPGCGERLQYEVDGNIYSRATSVEIRGVYDGGLFYAHMECGYTWHRWPEGNHLRVKAGPYMERFREGREGP